jgi:hypothetical protein
MTEKGQSTLELAAALIVVVLFLMASLKIFLWLNDRMVRRQVAYENTRIAAGSQWPEEVGLSSTGEVGPSGLTIGSQDWVIDESAYPALNIIN